MDGDRARRVVAALRDRGVMAHLVEAGVYEFGIRVVLDYDIEALWDTDGVSGLDAEVVSDGVLIGFVPHVPGSENFTDQQIIDTIAATEYSTEGLRPPEDGPPPASPSPAAPEPDAEPVPEERPPSRRHQRWAHWMHRGGD
ncbi:MULTISPECIES: hypothetical protein [Streptomyces]|uniref:Uncharacterized protein n=1 Tax=Streptomyces misionensis TaxID=67331 RepID=A0A1H4MTM3_9ACTN|nr:MULTISPECIES: hypothetical protein [Streptomyces]SEB86293.1 hypothetical protein SAMN04490357_0582 [Streptomyces misionensis]SFY49634.1 hypothetical protein STEPF1_02873 [Streptomyces sp. F-1]